MYTLDPKNILFLYAGAIIEGFADGSFVKVEYNTDAMNLSVGADGVGARGKSNNRSAKITLRLMPNSPSVLVMKGAIKLDESSLSAGSLPLTIVDSALTPPESFTALGAWVMKDPGRDFQTTIQGVEYVLETDELIHV